MCQPSAINAIEPKIEPPTISTTIIAAVESDDKPCATGVAVVLGAQKRMMMLPLPDRVSVHVCLPFSANIIIVA